MKKDIRSFKNMKDGITKEKAEEIFETLDENTKREAQTIEKVLKQYEGKSQSELMSEVTRIATQERKKGTLDNAKLDSFAKSVSPMLTKEQQERLNGLLGQIKQ